MATASRDQNKLVLNSDINAYYYINDILNPGASREDYDTLIESLPIIKEKLSDYSSFGPFERMGETPMEYQTYGTSVKQIDYISGDTSVQILEEWMDPRVGGEGTYLSNWSVHIVSEDKAKERELKASFESIIKELTAKNKVN